LRLKVALLPIGEKDFALVNNGPKDIHRRRAHEGGDKDIGWRIINFVRGANLLDFALIHHHDPAGHRHRFGLIVGDINHRVAQFFMEADEFAPHLNPEFGIEVRERLIEQEDLRVPDDRPAQGDPLALAARKLGWLSL
jgi:hypothetical protein